MNITFVVTLFYFRNIYPPTRNFTRGEVMEGVPLYHHLLFWQENVLHIKDKTTKNKTTFMNLNVSS